MKNSLFYAKAKFLSFSPEQQFKALDKLISALEMSLANHDESGRIVAHILELRELLTEPVPEKLQVFLRELRQGLSSHQLLNKLFYYHEAALRKDSQLSIRSGDGSIEADPRLRQKAAQVSVICDNLRSVFNIGSVFRTAECLGIGEILLCGISATPEHSNMEKTAMGTQSIVKWRYFESTEDAITDCRKKDYRIYALETVEGATSVFEANFQFPMALVIGNESLGIEPGLLKLCDEYLYLPQLGWKNSLNVGVASAICLYQIILGV